MGTDGRNTSPCSPPAYLLLGAKTGDIVETVERSHLLALFHLTFAGAAVPTLIRVVLVIGK